VSTIRLATFNTRHGRPPAGLARLGMLTSQCAALDADVLGLQEIDRHVVRSCFAAQAHRIGRALDMEVAWGPARRPILVGHEGNALLVRGTLADVEVVELPRSPERYRRIAVLARVALASGGELSVAVTHLQNHGPEAATQLPVLVDHLARRPAPRVLLGDLNLDRADVTPVLEAAGYTVADGGPTSPADRPVRQIDFIAVDGFEIRAAEVHPTDVSDHRPLTVDVAIKSR
jgi:endonuclease/exonuclease/phosphatase family metal-dependent hydrolase